MTQTKVFKFLKIIIYLISLFIIIIILLSKDTISNIKNINGLWHYKDMFFDTLWGNPYYFINLIYALISLSLLYLRIKTTHLIKEKKQYIIMIGSFMIPLLLGSTTDAIIPFFFTDFSLHLMPFLMAFYILGLYYAFLKYKLLDFNINDLFEEVLSNINDMVIILNEDGKILKVNERCLKTFLLSRENLINKTIYEIIEIKSSLKENLKNLFKGKISIFNAVVSFHKKNETITADSYFSRIIDKFGDFMGVLVILKENMDIKRFIIQFKLTYRQFEIIMLAVKGLTNNEICEKLNIKRRTLENHLFTIYYKLSIKNKVELVRLASDFNII
jgi:PAS domain S-box-containing protein